jgi:predicted transcriptional regulator
MEKEDKTAQHILQYLKEHPEAGDTLEGIAKWWVMLQQLNNSVDAVQTALQSLTTKGLIVERKGPDGRAIYLASRGNQREPAIRHA